MGKQVVATVRFPNSATTEERSFLSDLLLIKENLADEDYPATLFFFGNLSNPLQPTEKWQITETVAEVATSDNGLVLGTVTAINNSGQTTTVEYAFPCAGYTIKSTSVSYAESIINYRGLDYFVEETQAELVDAANAGGGGGGDTLFALTGTNTATGGVVGDLDGNFLTVESDGHTYFSISPEDGNEGVGLGARNTTGDGNIASLAANVTDTTTQVIVNADFNDGVNLSTITAYADASSASIDYASGSHNFSGLYGFDGDGALFHQQGFDDSVWYSRVGFATSSEIRLNATNLTLLMNDQAMIDLVYDGGDESLNIKMSLLEFADDAAAATGGVPVGGLYRTASVVKIRVA